MMAKARISRTPEWWVRVQELFHRSIELPPAERRAFVDLACGDDATLKEELLAFLAADEGGESLLDRGLPEIAYQMVGNFSDLPPSQEFGPYRLKHILGEGGMGVVWLAERSDVGTLVAIKFLPHAGLSPSRRERFLHEARTLARLKHPFIARLYDAGALADGTPWFAMEYVKGVPFTEYCRAKERSIGELMRLFRLVCEAVQYAHGQTVLHRDLKPSNILVEEDGTPKLLDFGIARELQQREDGGEQTRAGLRFMSPHYAAPEWVRDGVVGLPTDVYSLGVMLYEILTGRLPFDGQQGEAAAGEPAKPSQAIGNKRIAGLSKAAWSDLDVLCLKAIRADYGQRYATVEALIRDIDHFLRGEPLEARPPVLSYRLSKFVTRNRRFVLAAGVTVLLVVGLTVAFTLRLTRARDAALAESGRRERIQRFMVTMLGGDEKQAAPAKELRVVDILGRGEKEAAALSADPETQGELYETLGTVYDMLGEFPKADALLQLALQKKIAALGPDDQHIADTLVEIGVVKGDLNQFKEAVSYVNKGLALDRRHLRPDDAKVLDAESELGRVLLVSGDVKQSIAILEPLVQRAPANRDEEYTLSQSLQALGIAYQYTGHQDMAQAITQRSLELDRGLFGNDHPQVASDLANLASSRLTQGKFAEAEPMYRESQQIFQNWYGPDHPDTTTVTSLLARTLMPEGKDSEAEPILRAALAVEQKAYGGSDARIAFTLDALGKIELKRRAVADAVRDFTQAADMSEALVGEENYQTANIRSDLGDAYTKQGRFDKAEPILRNAVAMLVKTMPAGDPHIALAEGRWGGTLLALKRYGEAEKQLEAAYTIRKNQPHAPAAEVATLREELTTVYAVLHEPEKARKL
jgi:serine/threonine protein kinase